MTHPCHSYRLSHNSCQVTPLLLSIPHFAQHLNRWPLPLSIHIHHILGRGPLCNTPDNLIAVSNAAHTWGHDHNPTAFLAACLAAKAAAATPDPLSSELGFNSTSTDPWNTHNLELILNITSFSDWCLAKAHNSSDQHALKWLNNAARFNSTR